MFSAQILHKEVNKNGGFVKTFVYHYDEFYKKLTSTKRNSANT